MTIPTVARRLTRIALLGAGLLAPSIASATDVTLDLGLLTPAGTAACSTICNEGTNQKTFTNSGVSIGVDAYDDTAGGGTATGSWVTQKHGAFNAAGGESGVGQSQNSGLTDTDGEIIPNTYVLINLAAARAAGYQLTGVWVELMQTGEGARIYGYTGTFSTSALQTASLTSLGLMDGANGVTQEIVPSATYAPTGYSYLVNSLLATYNYIVITGAVITAGTTPDVAVSAVMMSNTFVGGGQGVPEPASIALFGAALAGLGALRRRRA